MKKRKAITLFCCWLLVSPVVKAQQSVLDSLFRNGDSTAVMDSLLKDFDLFLDSMSKPKSTFVVGLSAGTGFFSFENTNSVFITTEKRLMVSPMVGYFHKSGLGLSAAAYGVSESGAFNFYQAAVSPSYDLIRRKFSTGIAYSHYFTKDSLNFYTTPIRDELFAYFSWKRWWFRPTLSVSYGWGSSTNYEKEQRFIYSRLLQQSRSYYVTVKNVESVADFSLTLSIRKDFDWYGLFSKKDNFTITPVLMLNSGTQQFGFNTSYSYAATAIRVNSLPSNSSLSETTDFGLQSASGILRLGYMYGKFMIQPQVFFDYYLPPTEEKRLNTVFSINASVAF